MTKTLCSLLALLPLVAMTQSTASFKTERTDTFYKTIVSDPYRKLEDTGSANVRSWMKSESDRATALLKSLPGYQPLYKQVKKRLEESGFEEINSVERIAKEWYAIKRYPTQNNPVLYRYDARGKEYLVMDPVKAFPHLKSNNISLAGLFTSAHDRFLSYLLIVGGNESEAISFIDDRKTGRKNLDTYLNGPRKMPLAFDDRYDSVLYYAYAPFYGMGDPVHKYDSTVIYKHGIGRDSTTDELVIDWASQKIPRKREDMIQLDMPAACPWAMGIVKNMVSKELRIYVTPKATLSLASEWTPICDFADGVVSYVAHGDAIYLLTYKDASRFKVLRTSLSRPDLQHPVTVLPEQSFVINEMRGTKDQLLLTALSDEGGKLIAFPYATDKRKDLPLPVSGQVRFSYVSPRSSDVALTISSWTRTLGLYQYTAATGRITLSPIQQYAPIGAKGLEVKEVKARGADGVLIPMTLVYKKGTVLNGNNYVGFSAYGAYGHQDEPYYWPEDDIRFNNGYVRAVAHVRGGGIYGEDWHKAGMIATKPNTWKDVIACAEYLIANKWTSPKKLVLSGGSAGGITAGRSITERPDLFRAAVISVGCLDMVGAERAPNGFGNITEFGSTTTKEGFDALYEMSTYHHLKGGVAYPAVLFVHGFNDNRVPVWHSAKTYARLRELNPSGQPVLLRVNFDSGHGAQESTADLISRFTDTMSFIYWTLGYPAFQPKKSM
ncbi:MAG: f1pep1 2 [Flaviaesturariibacter sp.]|nr:f1pep1 2 [Flaviaesturariibacter sp.]